MKTIHLPADFEYLQLDEAAQLIANVLAPDTDENGNRRFEEVKIEVLEELTHAAKDGSLKIHHPRTLKLVTPVRPKDPIDAFFQAPQIQPYLCVVLVPDFALYVAERGLSVIVEAPAQSAAEPAPLAPSASDAPLAAETVAQRRSRWLDMFEAEEKREKRGALTRLAKSEGVDRANMSKDINRARAARDTEKRAGAWVSQVVQGGKRPR